MVNTHLKMFYCYIFLKPVVYHINGRFFLHFHPTYICNNVFPCLGELLADHRQPSSTESRPLILVTIHDIKCNYVCCCLAFSSQMLTSFNEKNNYRQKMLHTMHDTNLAHKKINYLETHISGSRTAEVGIIGRQA